LTDECQFDFEIRNLPEHSALPIFSEIEEYAKHNLLPEMHEISEDTGIVWRTLADFPALNTSIDDPLITEISALLGTTDRPGKVSYGTEGGRFQSMGISTIVCGPGSIEQAHKPDEFIELEQLSKGEQFLSALIRSLK